MHKLFHQRKDLAEMEGPDINHLVFLKFIAKWGYAENDKTIQIKINQH